MELITVYEVPVQSQAQPGAAHCNGGDPPGQNQVGWAGGCNSDEKLCQRESILLRVFGMEGRGQACAAHRPEPRHSSPCHTRGTSAQMAGTRTRHHRCHNLEQAWRAVTWSEKGDDSPKLGRAKAGPESGPSPSPHSYSRGQLHHPPCPSSALAGESWSPQRCRAQARCRQVPAPVPHDVPVRRHLAGVCLEPSPTRRVCVATAHPCQVKGAAPTACLYLPATSSGSVGRGPTLGAIAPPS